MRRICILDVNKDSIYMCTYAKLQEREVVFFVFLEERSLLSH